MNPSGPYDQQAPYGGGNQQQYQQQSQQPGGWNVQQPGGWNNQQAAYNGGDAKMGLAPDGYQGQRFEPEKPKFNDLPFAILFLLVFGGYVAVSVISLRGFSMGAADTITVGGGTLGSTLNGQTAVILMFSAGVSLLLSILYIFLVRTFPKFILEATLILSVLTTVAYCVYLWVVGQTSGAIVMTIFAVLAIVSYWFMRKRIPLAKIILVSVIRAADEYKSVYVLALSFLIIQTAWSVWTAWTLVAVYQRFSPGAEGAGSSASSGAVTGLVVLVVFAYYWSSELIKAVAYTSTAGVYGTWYYSTTKPAHAAMSSLKRSLTYSFGSLCFGSLILAVLDIIRAILQILQSQASQDGDMIGAALACVAGCLVGCIDWAITFFNRLAYTNIALYGNSFVKASKETWHLIKAKGIDALVNDCLVNNVWTFGSYAIGLLSGIAAYSWLYITNPSYAQNNANYYPVVILFSVGLGINIALALGAGAIGSGVTTMFVCLAEDPQIVAQRDPELFAALRQAYPQVIHAVDHS